MTRVPNKSGTKTFGFQVDVIQSLGHSGVALATPESLSDCSWLAWQCDRLPFCCCHCPHFPRRTIQCLATTLPVALVPWGHSAPPECCRCDILGWAWSSSMLLLCHCCCCSCPGMAKTACVSASGHVWAWVDRWLLLLKLVCFLGHAEQFLSSRKEAEHLTGNIGGQRIEGTITFPCCLGPSCVT